MTLAGANFALNAQEYGFNSQLNTQLRSDTRSDNQHRWQYRVRWYPQFTFVDPRWSAHSFVSTGDNFSGSHNTISTSQSDNLYLRHLFLRYQSASVRSEFGVIPTYKGRVSSSGLSKNGFIKGLRIVRQPFANAELELVVGNLDSTNAKDALDSFNKIDYLELELSARVSDKSSYEISLERMTGANFVRTEYRYQFIQSTALILEWIKRLDNQNNKVLVGVDTGFEFKNTHYALQAHYAYISSGIGLRAELTEDFRSTGHGVTAELKTPFFASDKANIVMRIDKTLHNSRFILGLEFKI